MTFSTFYEDFRAKALSEGVVLHPLPTGDGKPRNPLGIYGPWSWAIEPTRGCNLACGHCAVRLFDDSETGENSTYMSEEAWRAMFSTIAAITPKTRVEMANAGEPTLHPELPAFIKIARELSPWSQIQVTTNGTKLIDGSLSYRELFDNGANIVYTDMYAPLEDHKKLARESGIQWYRYHDKPKGAPGAWTYSSPDLKLIVLMENPANWPKSRVNLNRLGTFFNNLDWKASKRFDLMPVTEPVNTGCTQPFRYVSVHVNGSYELCCQDFMGETAGLLGNVLEGPEGFLKFWFSSFMQGTRRGLRHRDRSGSPYCSRCSITFSRSDMYMWKGDEVDRYFDGESWQELSKYAGPKLEPPPEQLSLEGDDES